MIGPEDVRAALADDDPETALTLALDAWRASRAPVVADVVEHVGPRAQELLDAPRERTKAAFQAAWLRLADRDPGPLATGWLASTLTTRLPVHVREYWEDWEDGENYGRRKYRAWFDRLSRLVDRPADPRVAAALIDVLERAPLSHPDCYPPALRLLARIGDLRGLPTLRALLATPRASSEMVRTRLDETLPDAIDGLAAVPVEAVDEDAWRALAPRPARLASHHHSADLLRAIRDDPDDDGARHVYADLLKEAGDPRGELIALQLAGVDDKRTRALIRQHGKDWLGQDLASILTNVVWSRGFLHSAALAQNSKATTACWERAVGDERLATLHRLEKGRANRERWLAFQVSPACRNLRDVEAATKAALGPLIALEDRRYATLRLGRGTRGQFEQIADAASCAELTHLHVDHRSLKALRRTPLLARLGELTLVLDGWSPDPAVICELLAQWPDLGLECLHLQTGAITYSLLRTPDGPVARWPYLPDSAGAWVPALPEDLHSLTVTFEATPPELVAGVIARSAPALREAMATHRPDATLRIADIQEP